MNYNNLQVLNKLIQFLIFFRHISELINAFYKPKHKTKNIIFKSLMVSYFDKI